jgi:hypothetical protein
MPGAPEYSSPIEAVAEYSNCSSIQAPRLRLKIRLREKVQRQAIRNPEEGLASFSLLEAVLGLCPNLVR